MSFFYVSVYSFKSKNKFSHIKTKLKKKNTNSKLNSFEPDQLNKLIVYKIKIKIINHAHLTVKRLSWIIWKIGLLLQETNSNFFSKLILKLSRK